MFWVVLTKFDELLTEFIARTLSAVVYLQFYPGPRQEHYKTYNTVLTELNMTFTILFTIEMILKQLGFGIRVRHYILYFNNAVVYFELLRKYIKIYLYKKLS